MDGVGTIFIVPLWRRHIARQQLATEVNGAGGAAAIAGASAREFDVTSSVDNPAKAGTPSAAQETWTSNSLEDWVALIVDGAASRAYSARRNELLATS